MPNSSYGLSNSLTFLLYLIIGNKQPSLHTPIERRQTYFKNKSCPISSIKLKKKFHPRVWVYSYMYASILLNNCIYYSLLFDFQFSYIQNNYRILLSYWLNKNNHNSRKKIKKAQLVHNR